MSALGGYIELYSSRNSTENTTSLSLLIKIMLLPSQRDSIICFAKIHGKE